jgi:hypothetical protein
MIFLGTSDAIGVLAPMTDCLHLLFFGNESVNFVSIYLHLRANVPYIPPAIVRAYQLVVYSLFLHTNHPPSCDSESKIAEKYH